MQRMNTVTDNPEAGCEHCILEHGNKSKSISHPSVLGQENKGLLLPLSPFHHYVHNEVLLSTAHVLIQDPSGNYTGCRAVLDSGSQVSLISHACALKLNLDLRMTHVHIEGITASLMNPIHHFTTIALRSIHDPTFRCQAKAYLVPEVTGELPKISFVDDMQLWPHLRLLTLADPEYNLSRGIDLLLGADCFPIIMRSEVQIGTEGQPMAQATAFGWVLLGPVKLDVQLTHPTECEVEDKGSQL